MTFNSEISLGHILLFLGFLATTVSLLLNMYQLRRTSRVQKSEFLFRVTDDLFTDSEFREFFYKVDYEKIDFDPDNFKGTKDERHLDALLYRYDLLGRLVKTNILAIKDIEFIAFEIVQVLKNKEVEKYIAWLDDQFRIYGGGKRVRPHDDVRWLLERLVKEP